MTEPRSIARGVTPSVAVVIVAVLASFVALTAINPSVAMILAIFGFLFGGDLLRELTAALDTGTDESTDSSARARADDPADALERLRVRYADGELSEAEFERRLEVLLETETVADVERYLEERGGEPSERGADGATAAGSDLDRDFERSPN